MNTLKEHYTDRWDRWIDYAEAVGIELQRLVVHPDDANLHRQFSYRGLPLVVLGEGRQALGVAA